MSKKISIRRQFIDKFNLSLGEDVLIKWGSFEELRKIKIVKFGAKKLHFYYYKIDENDEYGELSWHSLFEEHYEFIDIIKRGNPIYDKYFDKCIDHDVDNDYVVIEVVGDDDEPLKVKINFH